MGPQLVGSDSIPLTVHLGVATVGIRGQFVCGGSEWVLTSWPTQLGQTTPFWAGRESQWGHRG